MLITLFTKNELKIKSHLGKLTAAVQPYNDFKMAIAKEGRAFVSLNCSLALTPRPWPVPMQSWQIFRIEEIGLFSPLLEH